MCVPSTGSEQEHPRARGENIPSSLLRLINLGTSPRTRGKHSYGLSPARVGGNIPAHAGKTWEYPTAVVAVPGTSPRTRGKPAEDIEAAIHERNIPAHAGKT